MQSTVDEIFNNIVPEFENRFRSKNKDYGDAHISLGARGQFADLWRKINKLHKSLWLGEKLEHEQPEEVLFDMIGHCYLSILELRQNNEDGVWLDTARGDSERHADLPSKIPNIGIPIGPGVGRYGPTTLADGPITNVHDHPALREDT